MHRLFFVAVLCALAACQDSAAVYVARGNVLTNTGHLTEALEAYRGAVAVNPHAGGAWERLGDVLTDLGRRGEAKDAYAQAVAAEPRHVSLRQSYARALVAAGNIAGAREQLTAALDVAPTNLFARLSRGQLENQAGDRKAALADFEFAVHADGKSIPALYEFGLALLADGQLEPAERTFDRILELQPSSPSGWYGRARLKLAQGDRSGAATAAIESARRIAADAVQTIEVQEAGRAVRSEDLEAKAKALTARSIDRLAHDAGLALIQSDPGFRSAVGLPPLAAR